MLKAQKYCLVQRETWKTQKNRRVCPHKRLRERKRAGSYLRDGQHNVLKALTKTVTSYLGGNKTDGHLVEVLGMCVQQSTVSYNFKQQLL